MLSKLDLKNYEKWRRKNKHNFITCYLEKITRKGRYVWRQIFNFLQNLAVVTISTTSSLILNRTLPRGLSYYSPTRIVFVGTPFGVLREEEIHVEKPFLLREPKKKKKLFSNNYVKRLREHFFSLREWVK